jgi:hypothetical protein
MTHLYIIATVGTRSPVKIGIAEKPNARLRQLQTGNPQKLEVVETFEAGSRAEAAGWEFLAHKLFEADRLSGEWFAISADVVIDHVEHWKTDPVRHGRKHPSRPLPAGVKVVAPAIPEHLKGRRLRSMSEEDRLDYWACFDLSAPPYGFDDWFVVGSPTHGILAAFPVVGFMDESDENG